MRKPALNILCQGLVQPRLFYLFIVSICFVVTYLVTIDTSITGQSLFSSSFSVEENNSIRDRNCSNLDFDFSLMVFVKPDRKQIHRLKTMLLPSLALFWPQSNLNIVFVTDPDGKGQLFSKTIVSLANQILPKSANISVKFTNGVEKILDIRTKAGALIKERNKQIPKFWADNFTNSEFIGIVDTDTLFVTPVLSSDLFVNSKPVIRGAFRKLQGKWLTVGAKNAEEILGLNYIAYFMDYFPVVIRRQDLIGLRHYLTTRHKVDYFNQVFDNISPQFSEFTIIAIYLWHIEHERYHWVLEKSLKSTHIPSSDGRIEQYLQRRLVPVSNHFPRAQRHLGMVKEEVVLLIGMCYADLSKRSICDQLKISPSDYYNQTNRFQWVFEFEDWSLIDPQTAITSHLQRMNILEQCDFQWNSDIFSNLLNKVQIK